MNLAEHPTVRRFRESNHPGNAEPSQKLDAAWLRQLCLDCGADDAGLVEISRSALDGQRADILRAFPPTRTLLSFVCRMNREPIRSPARSVANREFHHTGDHVNEVARKVVATLEKQGIRALNPAMGFPMEMDRFPGGKIWVVSHKPVAVAAGLGYMGIHRNNPMGTLHGGIDCDLADAAMDYVFAAMLGEGETFTTVELKINFFRPVRQGKLTAEARGVKAGGTLGYVECDVKDQTDKLVARAANTCMKMREARPTT